MGTSRWALGPFRRSRKAAQCILDRKIVQEDGQLTKFQMSSDVFFVCIYLKYILAFFFFRQANDLNINMSFSLLCVCMGAHGRIYGKRYQKAIRAQGSQSFVKASF